MAPFSWNTSRRDPDRPAKQFSKKEVVIYEILSLTIAPVYSFWWKPFLLLEAIVFIDFMVFKDQLIAISEYLYTSCVDPVY